MSASPALLNVIGQRLEVQHLGALHAHGTIIFLVKEPWSKPPALVPADWPDELLMESDE